MSKRRLGAHPSLLGFERFDGLLERAERIASDAGPPYNIAMCGPGRYRIQLALPGYEVEQLEVIVEPGALLVVKGAPKPAETGSVYLHRGIATKAFARNFVLADGVDVIGADLADGLLTIDLNQVGGAAGPERIAIKAPSGRR